MTMRLIELSELITPKNGYKAIVNQWWVENSEGKILDWIVGNCCSPQTNRDKKVVEYLIANNKTHYEGCKAVFVPLAFYPIQND